MIAITTNSSMSVNPPARSRVRGAAEAKRAEQTERRRRDGELTTHLRHGREMNDEGRTTRVSPKRHPARSGLGPGITNVERSLLPRRLEWIASTRTGLLKPDFGSVGLFGRRPGKSPR